MPFGLRVELRRREVGRERDDVAEVLRRLDDVDPLAVGDGRDLVVDQVLASPDHDVAVGVEGLLERRRVVGLQAVDDLGLGRAVVDLRRRPDPGGLLGLELVLPDLEDRVGVEAVERPQPDELVISLAAERPVVGPGGERFLQPGAVVGDRCPGRVGGRGEAPAVGLRQVGAGGHDLGEERRQIGGRLDLELLPAADLRDDGPAARLLEPRGHGLEPAGDRVEALRQRREVLGEDEEQRVADDIERGRAALPRPDLLGVEDLAPDVVDLEVALEAGVGGEGGLVERLDRREVGLLGRQLAEDGVAGAVAEAMVLGVDAEIRPDERVVGDHPPEAGLDEVVEALVERTGVRCGLGRVRTTSWRVSVTRCSWGRGLAARPVRILSGSAAGTGWVGPAKAVSVADRAGSCQPAGLAQARTGAAPSSARASRHGGRDPLDVRCRDPAVRRGPDLAVRVPLEEDAAGLRRGEERRPVRGHPEEDEVRRDPRGVEGRVVGAGLGDVAGRADAGDRREELRQAAGVGVVLGEPGDHPRLPVPRGRRGRPPRAPRPGASRRRAASAPGAPGR